MTAPDPGGQPLAYSLAPGVTVHRRSDVHHAGCEHPHDDCYCGVYWNDGEPKRPCPSGRSCPPVQYVSDVHADAVRTALANLVAQGYRVIDPDGIDVTESVRVHAVRP